VAVVRCPPIRAALVWPRLSARLRSVVGRAGWVAPQYTRLAMGATHAAYLVMLINLRVIGMALCAGATLPPLGLPHIAGLGWQWLACSPDLGEAAKFFADPLGGSLSRCLAQLRRQHSRVVIVLCLLASGPHRAALVSRIAAELRRVTRRAMLCLGEPCMFEDSLCFHEANVVAEHGWVDSLLLALCPPGASPSSYGVVRDPRCAELERLVRTFDWVPSDRPGIAEHDQVQYSHTLREGPIYDLVRSWLGPWPDDGVQVGRFDWRWTHFRRHRDRNNSRASLVYTLGEFEGGVVRLAAVDPTAPPSQFSARREWLHFEGRREHWMDPVSSGLRFSIVYFAKGADKGDDSQLPICVDSLRSLRRLSLRCSGRRRREGWWDRRLVVAVSGRRWECSRLRTAPVCNAAVSRPMLPHRRACKS